MLLPDLLPTALRGRPFTVAEAVALGLSPDLLRSPQLVAPAWGVRSDVEPSSLGDRCLALGTALQDRFAFSHLTAARLYNLPISGAMDDDERLHVVRDTLDGSTRRPGVAGHRGIEARHVDHVNGIPVTSLADTWVDMGELIGPGKPVGLDDLIVLGDAIALRLGSVQPMREALEKRVRPRGKLTLLEALEWIRYGAQSPGETRTRLVLVRAGLPEPALNRPIITAERIWLGRPDLMWRDQRVLIEYQGEEFHTEKKDRARDEARHAGFRDDDWEVVLVWKDGINSTDARRELVLRIAELLGIPREALTLDECEPRFFSRRMLELAEIRSRRQRARRSA